MGCHFAREKASGQPQRGALHWAQRTMLQGQPGSQASPSVLYCSQETLLGKKGKGFAKL